jgi:2-keto-4-pentenoate hydratase/2-oxohepta-3-ene-1,7-dioic acid hydratase in catechol pathway
MKIVRFGHDGRVRYGALEGDRIEPLDGTLDALTRMSRAKRIPLNRVRILAPVIPSKIVAAGLNYSEIVRDLKIEPPKEPLLFIKPSTAVIGPNDAIVCTRGKRSSCFTKANWQSLSRAQLGGFRHLKRDNTYVVTLT